MLPIWVRANLSVDTLLEKNEDDDSVLFMTYGASQEPESEGNKNDDDQTIIINKFEECIIKTTTSCEQQNQLKNENTTKTISSSSWILDIEKVKIKIASMEEEEYISEDTAYELWLNDNEINRTSNLGLVPSPDGHLIQPCHNTNTIINNNNNNNNNNGDGDGDGGEEEAAATATSSSLCQKQQQEQEEGEKTSSASISTSLSTTTIIKEQLQRDPTLFDYDNVRRISISEFLLLSSTTTWKEEPIVLTGFFQQDEDESNNKLLLLKEYQHILSRQNLIDQFGTVIVRTGNRETLIENGFNSSVPKTIKDALLILSNSKEEEEISCRSSSTSSSKSNNNYNNNGTIIFSPIKELKDPILQNDLNSIVTTTGDTTTTTTTTTAAAAAATNSIFESILDDDEPKYALCIANQQGFGIGMHKHGPALFVLCLGRKKWYMSPPKPIDDDLSQDKSTHPEFYTTKSTHKCIQNVGEILFVPNQWYHEIYNIDDYTAGIQVLGQEQQ